jgi:hypothetical protein
MYEAILILRRILKFHFLFQNHRSELRSTSDQRFQQEGVFILMHSTNRLLL